MEYIEKIETSIGTFLIDIRDKFVAKQLRDSLDYSPMERKRYEAFLSPTSKVLWLGAHIGALIIPLSKLVQSITAFEANPYTYSLLMRNLDLNNCVNVRSFNYAANDMTCDLKFICNTVNSGGSKRMPRHMRTAYIDEKTKFVEVKAVSLDDFLKEKDFDFIFMDIEGSETAALSGMPKILAHSKFLVTEFIPHHLTYVAGASVADFLRPLSDFQTLMVPSMRRHVYGGDIQHLLERMMHENRADPGLIFYKEKKPINWV